MEGDGEARPVDPADVVPEVEATCFRLREDRRASPGRVGIELERFPVHVGVAGRPAGRVPIGTPAGSLALLDTLSGAGILDSRTEVGGVPSYPVAGGGRVTFEPGGAIEHATAPHATATAALAELDTVSAALAAALAAAGVSLVSAGVDSWHPLEAAPQQLDAARYRAMHEYLGRRGGAGALMMRHTCSLQVNLDLGSGDDWRVRWDVANLLAPVVTATFAHSPSPVAASVRAQAWQALDPTRTGFPGGMATSSDPVAQMADAALDADVMMVMTEAQGGVPGTPGWSFRSWIDGDLGPAQRPPTLADLRYHLTTLFHEVRPRGFLEIRGVDALPARWRVVPIALLVGALEDATARARIQSVLDPIRNDLHRWWKRAARDGVREPELCALAVEVWSFARAGAARLPADYLPSGAIVTVDEFLDRFTLRGRCPADGLRDLLDGQPAEALRSVSEPIPASLDARS